MDGETHFIRSTQKSQDCRSHQLETQLCSLSVHLESIVQVVLLIFIHRLFYQKLGSLQPELTPGQSQNLKSHTNFPKQKTVSLHRIFYSCPTSVSWSLTQSSTQIISKWK